MKLSLKPSSDPNKAQSGIHERLKEQRNFLTTTNKYCIFCISSKKKKLQKDLIANKSNRENIRVAVL